MIMLVPFFDATDDTRDSGETDEDETEFHEEEMQNDFDNFPYEDDFFGGYLGENVKNQSPSIVRKNQEESSTPTTT